VNRRKDGCKLTSMTNNQNHKSSNNNQDDHRAKTFSLEEQAELISKSQVVDSLALLFF
jgi:hypothetical protein